MTLREAYRTPREWKHTDVKKPYMIVCSLSKRLWTGVKEKTSRTAAIFAVLLYTEECQVWKKDPGVEAEPSSSQGGDPKGTGIRTEVQSMSHRHILAFLRLSNQQCPR